ncbi:MAG: hypothetical protein IT480_17390, partial [Gammaproteobacteria bacterium]|nr:hypothetical protein [Gammaproteobacteria bacterium]
MSATRLARFRARRRRRLAALALLGGALAGCTASPTPMTSPRATQTQPATALQQQLATLEA